MRQEFQGLITELKVLHARKLVANYLFGSGQGLQAVSHAEHGEVVLIFKGGSIHVGQRRHESVSIDFVGHSHLRVSRDIKAVQLVVEFPLLFIGQSVIYGHHSDAGLLQELNVVAWKIGNCPICASVKKLVFCVTVSIFLFK